MNQISWSIYTWLTDWLLAQHRLASPGPTQTLLPSPATVRRQTGDLFMVFKSVSSSLCARRIKINISNEIDHDHFLRHRVNMNLNMVRCSSLYKQTYTHSWWSVNMGIIVTISPSGHTKPPAPLNIVATYLFPALTYVYSVFCITNTTRSRKQNAQLVWNVYQSIYVSISRPKEPPPACLSRVRDFGLSWHPHCPNHLRTQRIYTH